MPDCRSEGQSPLLLLTNAAVEQGFGMQRFSVNFPNEQCAKTEPLVDSEEYPESQAGVHVEFDGNTSGQLPRLPLAIKGTWHGIGEQLGLVRTPSWHEATPSPT
jgi:hypothetical protein